MEQPTQRGRVHVVYNTKLESGTESVQLETTVGPLTLTARNRWPALAAVTNKGNVVAIATDGTASIGGRALLSGVGLTALLSLDGLDLCTSEAMLVAPFETGTLGLTPREGPWTVVFGDFYDGRWRTLERIPMPADHRFQLDEDRATCLILVCRPDAVTARTAQLTTALQRPDQVEGF